MRFAVLAVGLGMAVAISSPAPAAAQNITINGTSQDSVLRFTPRRTTAEATRSMISRSGDIAMLHIGSTVVLQLTEQGLENLGRSAEAVAEQSGFRQLIDGMVRGGLRVLLDRGMEYDLADVADVRYDNGGIVFENRRGERMFERFEVNGEQVMESFHEREARAFVAHLRRALPR